MKAPNGRPISDEAATVAASTLAHDYVGWRILQWLQRSLVPGSIGGRLTGAAPDSFVGVASESMIEVAFVVVHV